MAKYLALDSSNRRVEVQPVNTSAGAGDAAKIPELDAAGLLSITMMPAGIGADTSVVVASENLLAGDYVRIYDDGGTATCRKADASTAAFADRADGFVLAAVTAAANATVYHEGRNNQLSGLTAGVTYALSAADPGEVVALSAATTTAGHILQVIGVAVNTTTINTEIQEPILRV
jgi:hypothetical protein